MTFEYLFCALSIDYPRLDQSKGEYHAFIFSIRGKSQLNFYLYNKRILKILPSSYKVMLEVLPIHFS